MSKNNVHKSPTSRIGASFHVKYEKRERDVLSEKVVAKKKKEKKIGDQARSLLEQCRDESHRNYPISVKEPFCGGPVGLILQLEYEDDAEAKPKTKRKTSLLSKSAHACFSRG